MLKQISFSIIVLLILSSCRNTSNENNDISKMVAYSYNKNYQYSIDTIDVLIDTKDSITYTFRQKSTKKNDWQLELKILIGDTLRIIKEDKQDTGGEIYKYIDAKVMWFYNYDNRPYCVYRILYTSGAMDSEGLLFWSPEFGIILGKSLAWKTFVRYEYLNGETKNEIVRHLCYLIINDKEFYNLPDWDKMLF